MIGKYVRLEWVIGKVIAIEDDGLFRTQNPLWNSTMSTHPDQRLLTKDLPIVINDDPPGLIRVGDMIELLYTGNNSYSLQTVVKITKNSIETTNQTISTNQALNLHPSYTEDSVEMKWLPMIREIWTKKDDNTIVRQWVYQS